MAARNRSAKPVYYVVPRLRRVMTMDHKRICDTAKDAKQRQKERNWFLQNEFTRIKVLGRSWAKVLSREDNCAHKTARSILGSGLRCHSDLSRWLHNPYTIGARAYENDAPALGQLSVHVRASALLHSVSAVATTIAQEDIFLRKRSHVVRSVQLAAC
jgi:hypothetical protein